MVTDAEAFTREFRTGRYSVYGLFSEKEKISEQAQQELREAVFRGEGLLVAGGHDHRHNKLDSTLGLKFKGKLSHTEGIDVFLFALPVTGAIEWGVNEKVLNITSQGAEVVAYYLAEEQAIASTRHGYGEGRSFFAGFDLLAQASQPNADPLWDELILTALQDIEPETARSNAGAATAVHLNLVNQGIATPGEAIITVPENTTILDSGLAQQVNNRLFWTFNLAEAVEDSLNVWLQLPLLTDRIVISSLIQVGVAPELSDYENLELTLPIETATTLLDVLALPELQQKPFQKIRKEIEEAQQYLEKGDYAKALKYAIKATDYFEKQTAQQAKTIRLQLDDAIRVLAQQL